MLPIYVTVERLGPKPRHLGVGCTENSELKAEFRFKEAGTSVVACTTTLKMSREGKAILFIEVTGKEPQRYEFDTGS